ncbi:MAG: FHA domain-containing protein [Planctomycetota bacterium]
MAKPPNPAPVGRQPAAGGGSCPQCNNPIVAGLPFCPKCGKRVSAPKDEGPSCPNCGTAVQQGAGFCAACGTPLGPDAPKSRTSAFAAQRVDVPGELVVLEESGEVSQRFPLAGEETTIGRDGASIEFTDDPFMSPLHAQVTAQDGQFSVRDLGSRNGTWTFIAEPHRLTDGDLLLVGSQVLLFRRLGYPGPHPPERDATRRMGSLVPSADIARLIQLRSDGSQRDTIHLSPGRNLGIGRDSGDWIFPYDPSMSGLHAEVRSEDADFVVVDAGSRNGVALSVRGEISLKNGSRFLVGDKMLRLEAP